MIVVSARSYAKNVGGNSRYIRELAKRLPLLGLDLSFISPARTNTVDWAIFEATRMQKLASAKGAKAVWFPVDTGPLRSTSTIKTVLTLHGVGALHEPTLRNPVMSAIWLTRARCAARAANTIITVSQSSADDIVTLAGEDIASKIIVIPHGIAPEWFEPPGSDNYSIERDFDLSRPFALYYGNIEPRKNLSLALKALDIVRETYRDLQFVVSGAPAWQSKPILQELTSRSWVHHIGRRSDEEIRTLLAACRFFIFPSRYEGFGLPVLEALAAGAPVVASNRGALPEVAGHAAFLVSQLTPDDVAAACFSALSADRTSVAEAGVRQASLFSWEKSAQHHLEVLNVQ